jgi:hypothetical protein
VGVPSWIPKETPCTAPLSDPVPVTGPREIGLHGKGRSHHMTITGDERTLVPEAPAAPAGPSASPARAAALAAVVIGVLAATLYRHGGFYPADAFGVVIVAVPLIVAGIVWNRDRHGLAVVVGLGGLAAWWLVRALMERKPAAFLPLGASFLAFVASYLVVRSLVQRDRSRVASAVVAVGAVVAAGGVVGVLGRWSSLAQLTGGAWSASTTLTYPAAVAVVCAVGLLVALALDLRSPICRLAVCLCLAGVLVSRSHWDLLALGCGALLLPAGRWLEGAWPLAMGAVAGLVVVSTSTGHSSGGWAWVVTSMAVVASLAPLGLPHGRRVRRTAAVAGVAAAGLIVAVVYLPVGTTHPSSDQGQTLAWSSSVDAWRSSAVTGVGPPRTSTVRGSVASYPGLVPDSYLTVTADGGVVGALLLLAGGAAVAAAVRRRDLLSSGAAAATVAFAVSGFVDFSWQLPAVALLGGCVAGLAAGPAVRGKVSGPAPTVAPRRRPGGAIAWVVVVVAVVAVQMVVGSGVKAGGTSPAPNVEPAPTAHPERPGRTILTGADPTDPYMIKTGGRYLLYTSEGTSFLNVPLWIGTRPGRWLTLVDVLPNLPNWAQGGSTWAPDVQRVTGGWALYFTTLVRGLDPPTRCIGSAFSRSPRGPFVATTHAFICQLDHRGSIDPRVFVESDGRLVMLWKSEDNANPAVPGPDQDGPTGIYAQYLSANGRTLLGQPVKILTPTEPWEGTIVEAPDMIEAWGTYWLFFSGNWFNQPSYGIGVAACQTPFGPCTDPNPAPLLGSNLQGAGPGEASVFKEGDTDLLLYNPFKGNDPGPAIPRPVDMTRLGFTPQGPYLAAS